MHYFRARKISLNVCPLRSGHGQTFRESTIHSPIVARLQFPTWTPSNLDMSSQEQSGVLQNRSLDTSRQRPSNVLLHWSSVSSSLSSRSQHCCPDRKDQNHLVRQRHASI